MRLRFLLLLLLSSATRAQPAAPDWLRAQVLDCPGHATADGLLTDAAGNTYLTGIFDQTLTLAPGTTLTATGLQDSYLAKYAPGGSLLWSQHLAGTSYTVAHDVVSDAQGNVYVGGSFTQRMSMGSLSLNNPQGNTYLFLAKINAQGQPQWLRQLGGGSMVVSSGMGMDAAGNAYFTGTFVGSLALGGTTLQVGSTPGSFDSEIFLAKFDQQGQLVWARQGGHEAPAGASSTYYQYSPHLLVSPAGASYLTWTSTPGAGGFGPLPLPAAPGDNDAVVVKYDAQGTPAWVFAEGGAGNDLANRAVLDGTGQLLVSGSYQGLASFGAYTLASTDQGGLLLALDEATGRVNWAQELASTAALFGPAISGLAVDAAGNSYVAASLITDAHVDGVSFLNGGSWVDGLVLSFTPQGSLRWGQQADGPGDEIPGHIALLPNGELLLTGNLNGTGRFGAHSISSNPLSAQNPTKYLTNPFVARLGRLPAATRPAQAAALSVYPNPVARGAAVQLPLLPAGTQVVVSDALGRRVWRGTAAAQLTIPMALAPGDYVVLATAPDARQWRSRLVVE